MPQKKKDTTLSSLLFFIEIPKQSHSKDIIRMLSGMLIGFTDHPEQGH